MNELSKYWESTGGVWAEQNVTRENNKIRMERRIDTAKTLVNLIDGYKSPSILEVGCNYGENLRLIGSMNSDVKLVGCDISPDGIKMAKKRVKNCDFQIMEAGRLQFPPQSFDIVFTMGVMIHIHPDNARVVFDNIEKMSNKYICHVELTTEEHFAKSNKTTTRTGKSMQYIFLHNYETAHPKSKYRVIDKKYVGENLTRIIYEKTND